VGAGHRGDQAQSAAGGGCVAGLGSSSIAACLAQGPVRQLLLRRPPGLRRPCPSPGLPRPRRQPPPHRAPPAPGSPGGGVGGGRVGSGRVRFVCLLCVLGHGQRAAAWAANMLAVAARHAVAAGGQATRWRHRAFRQQLAEPVRGRHQRRRPQQPLTPPPPLPAAAGPQPTCLMALGTSLLSLSPLWSAMRRSASSRVSAACVRLHCRGGRAARLGDAAGGKAAAAAVARAQRAGGGYLPGRLQAAWPMRGAYEAGGAHSLASAACCAAPAKRGAASPARHPGAAAAAPLLLLLT
jgi:hypothetical protein